jgi:predicted nucleic acid-binding protein
MIFLVNDANILIDLLKLNLLDTFFQLDYDFQVTDLVLGEVREDNIEDLGRYLEASLLTKQGFTAAEIGEISALFATFPALSFADCSCIFLAEKLSATLLTGDGALRRIATERELPVHGILWVLDHMIECGLLGPKRRFFDSWSVISAFRSRSVENGSRTGIHLFLKTAVE